MVAASDALLAAECAGARLAWTVVGAAFVRVSAASPPTPGRAFLPRGPVLGRLKGQ